jgi:hypothetical protein
MPRPRRLARRDGLPGDKRSAAALEFAFIAPILVILLFGVYDISDAMITYEEVFNAARVMSASASNASVQGSNSSTKLYWGQIQLEASAIFAQMPTVRNGFHNGIKSITISSINFEPVVTNPACTPGKNCTYDAYVVWSAAYAGPPSVVGTTGLSFNTPLRTCATETNNNGTITLNTASALVQTGPTGSSAGSLGDLRTLKVTTDSQWPAAPDPIIVVDVNYVYSPIFTMFLKAPISFWADGYWPLRSVQATQLNQQTGTFTTLAPDQQYTGLVSTQSTSLGVNTYTIENSNLAPSGIGPVNSNGNPDIALPVAGSNYCISQFYAEPSS